jgi:hypothetical protein
MRYSNSQSSPRCLCKEAHFDVDRHPKHAVASVSTARDFVIRCANVTFYKSVCAPLLALVSVNKSVTRAVSIIDQI